MPKSKEVIKGMMSWGDDFVGKFCDASDFCDNGEFYNKWIDFPSKRGENRKN